VITDVIHLDREWEGRIMRRFKFSLLSFLLACTLLSLAIATFYKDPGPAKLTIEIVEDDITVSSRVHFHVLFTNHSNQRVRLWDEWIMWGHTNLSFELLDSKKQRMGQLTRTYSWFGRNFPRYAELQPGERFIMDIHFDPNKWSIPVKPGADYDCFLVAKYDVNRTSESDQHEVWVGTIESKPKKISLRYWNDTVSPDSIDVPQPATD